MTPQPLKIRADIEMKCFQFDGVLHIKDALRKAEAAGNQDCPVKIKLVAPPSYVLITQTVDKTQVKVIDMASRRNVNYTHLPDEDNDSIGNEGRYDPRFDYSPSSMDEVPWKSIALALFLLAIGCGLLLLSKSLHIKIISLTYGLLGLGALTFLPGFYETRIAYYAWRGAQGYRLSGVRYIWELGLSSSFDLFRAAVHNFVIQLALSMINYAQTLIALSTSVCFATIIFCCMPVDDYYLDGSI
ncbi:hypothetical protein L2E82_32464 [Cichorium intybus]|uniref:Uncharacterized protein n=1 Tax=Cichorium intybus TaxID=13427 RepID=A0ACB9BHA7_CICIN|nr:hypothetical protein L2E82_32464 [Cichorium intybus]